MALITLTSDLGTRDYFLAALKGAIISECDSFPNMMDISHEIKPFDIKEAAYVIGNAYKYFPKGTIHVIHAGASLGQNRLLLCEADGHYFITFDNGVLSLIFGQASHKIFQVNEELAETSTLLSEKQIAHTISLLLQEYLPKDFAQPFTSPVNFHLLQPVVNKGSIRGSVIYFDHFGNAVSNISKAAFKQFTEGKRFLIHVNVGKANQLSTNYHDVEEGEICCLINAAGLLEIGISRGKAENLLGLKIDSSVLVLIE